MRAFETTGRIEGRRIVHLDDDLPDDMRVPMRVILLFPESNELTEQEWLRAAASNPAFADLADSREDIYTVEDGEPFGMNVQHGDVPDRETIVNAAAVHCQREAFVASMLYDLAASSHPLVLRPVKQKGYGFAAQVRVGRTWLTIFRVATERSFLWFQPQSVAKELGASVGDQFEGGLRQLFGSQLRIGSDGFYYSVRLGDARGHLDGLRDLVMSILP